MLPETLIRTLYDWSHSLVPTSHMLQGECARISFKVHRPLPVSIFSVKIAALGSLNGLMEEFSKLVSHFKGAS